MYLIMCFYVLYLVWGSWHSCEMWLLVSITSVRKWGSVRHEIYSMANSSQWDIQFSTLDLCVHDHGSFHCFCAAYGPSLVFSFVWSWLSLWPSHTPLRIFRNTSHSPLTRSAFFKGPPVNHCLRMNFKLWVSERCTHFHYHLLPICYNKYFSRTYHAPGTGITMMVIVHHRHPLDFVCSWKKARAWKLTSEIHMPHGQTFVPTVLKSF